MKTSRIPAILSYRGKKIEFTNITPSTTGKDLYLFAMQAFGLTESQVKLLHRGKRLEDSENSFVFEKEPSKTPRIMVIATSCIDVKKTVDKRSDPTIRGFDQEKVQPSAKQQYWGEGTTQDKDFKFCRFQACTWQSFGNRPADRTPHTFAAMNLLEKLATDPGIVAIMKERDLVVGTLGEMDPIDDRYMQQKQQHGGCLLGYNTNAGARIDIKLRTDDLEGFRPYSELASTLIHELSHNWVGEHNLLFWTNYAQMRAEYMFAHASLQSTLVRGRTTADLAGLNMGGLHVFDLIMQELVQEMGQFGLHPNMIEGPIRQRCQELQKNYQQGKQLGKDTGSVGDDATAMTPRERALAAANRRIREQNKEE
uniref:WLM domain-containing protein n=1 Tax=Corethron hystrix TaxID=216773 RepID=A0A7S1BB43_9STRA|mmetsp:Transcript_20085/g.45522  ORF Transcript_20085/g.45522 Transcript_20085/m.45522 type:complete len:367 (+) Transcript_20085:203-1303(+)|eukprot:CAMPEP_0113301036 /NCGR_PEP_ID=MMETSP0010_2-20120614/2429_1 /TAXON_ID=216773 ORGANISM="Corethron hystrix, Strain 308" /NCGR_SAMPLE_ID=MMETSP0010_2 /ASSEMBLY_ACC=CAM_ASM_000155 /LENGTH=366 /DNA_ID=CAMNT_0000154585 /DNA_START=169 /DNA_END=1269 /DNA_ORIENTATION=- /assembly_acc=CAM_ASM_000155